MVDSLPIPTVKTGECLRYLGSLVKKKLYSKYNNTGIKNKYVCVEETAVRNFIKGLVSSPPLYNLPIACYTTSQDIIDLIRGYNPELKISVESISRYKSRRIKLGKVKKSKETDGFVKYIQRVYPSFDVNSFYLSEMK
jgi:hypothetical protein